jgi:uncharacterized protein
VRLLVDGEPVAPLELADTARTRRRGLLGRDGLDGALWLRPCGQVHSIRMRFAIDVAHLDRDGVVLRVVTLRPGRIGPLVLRGRSVVEAEAGRFAGWGVRVGARLTVGEEAPSVSDSR